MSKMKIKRKETYTRLQAENDQIELNNIKMQKKMLEAREEELKARLTPWMENNLPTDSKGHRLFTVKGADGKPVHLQRQARKSIKLNQERAVKYLRENEFEETIITKEVIAEEVTQDQIIDAIYKAKLAGAYLEQVEAVDEDAFAKLVSEGYISMEDAESLADIKITYAMAYIDDEKIKEEQEKESATDAVETNRESIHSAGKKDSTVSNRKARKRIK